MKNIWRCLFAALISLVLSSCSSDGLGNDDMDISQNEELLGTRWDLKTWDYSLGDEYVGIHDETYTVYFYSQTNGILYYGRKDQYSDQGTMTTRAVAHFKYSVNGNDVELDYITDKILPIYEFEIDGDILVSEGLEFFKGSISTTDREWISTMQGESGSCMWYSDIQGNLWIIGNGDMADYSSFAETPWAKANRVPNKVIVEEGVTSIGAYAFASSSIYEVEMPDRSLEKVGDAAFKSSTIKTIWLSNKTKYIGECAFYSCKYLEDINIPDEIELIEKSAFESCEKLNVYRLQFSESLKRICTNAFFLTSASYLIFSEGLEVIESCAFIGDFCTISKEIILPNSLTELQGYAIEGPYKKIVIGTGLRKIGNNAFISGATSGEMYVNLSTPPTVGDNIIVERTYWNPAESRWTLYVPKGCKSAYQNKSPWNKFKAIIEDETLIGEGNNDSGTEDDNGVNGEYSDKRQDETDANSPNRGYVASGFAGGSGTSTDPYRISNAAELRYFSDAVRQGNIFKNQYVKLAADITINRNVLTSSGELNGDGSDFEPWIPIGRYDPSFFFCGTFDGNNHYISGLYCDRPQGEFVGLFGKLYGNVKNVIIKDSYFRGNGSIGGIAGSTRPNYIGTTIPSSIKEYYQTEKTISIVHCKNEATIVGETGGGIIGYNTNATKVSKCLNSGYIKGHQNVGGIVGKSSSTTSYPCIISDCANLGTIISEVQAGGILCNGIGTSIINSLNWGCVKSPYNTNPIGVGGICGVAGKSQSNKIQNCVNYSLNIEGLNRLGAVIGYNNGLTVSKNIYLYKSGLSAIGGSSSSGSASSNVSKTESEMKSQATLDLLNSRAGSSYSKWKFGDDGFPVLEWME